MKTIGGIFIAFALILAVGCASTPAQQDTKPGVPDLTSQNEQLSNYPISGFAYKSSKLNTAKWDQWAKDASPIVQEILDKLPEGYALQVTGHADASGPEEPVGNKPGNIKISTDRAKTVYNALGRANISSPKMTYKGVGSDELLPEYDPKAAEQRRVTFKIVPAE
ncbi:MAG: OmpA family protein [Spirochaetes bacterium]|nr:OmpA family protein [Spirochaetota bacterium]